MKLVSKKLARMSVESINATAQKVWIGDGGIAVWKNSDGTHSVSLHDTLQPFRSSDKEEVVRYIAHMEE